MQKYWFSQTLSFPYKDRIVEIVVIRENTCQEKPVFLHILHSVSLFDGIS